MPLNPLFVSISSVNTLHPARKDILGRATYTGFWQQSHQCLLTLPASNQSKKCPESRTTAFWNSLLLLHEAGFINNIKRSAVPIPRGAGHNVDFKCYSVFYCVFLSGIVSSGNAWERRSQEFNSPLIIRYTFVNTPRLRPKSQFAIMLQSVYTV